MHALHRCAASDGCGPRLLAVSRSRGWHGPLRVPPPALLLQSPILCRCFGTTDGPWRHIKPKPLVKEKKKHYGEVLTMASVRKLVETAQDAVNAPSTVYPLAFWEVMAKRCIQSMHLLNPLELAIVARAFDTHSVELKSRLDVYGQIAKYASGMTNFPGVAILIFTDILPRRIPSEKVDLTDLFKMLGRQLANVLFEVSAAHALRILEALTKVGVRDPPLCQRVARKVYVQLWVPDALDSDDLARAASIMAAQEHRDLPVLLAITNAASLACEDNPSTSTARAGEAVLAALDALTVDGAEEVERLRVATAAARSSLGDHS